MHLKRNSICLIICLSALASCQQQRLEPVALEPEDMCSFCRMAISEKRYAAQLVDSEGQVFKFDEIGCLVNFMQRNNTDAANVARFVMDFDERIWIKAEDAYYVKSSEVTTPMNGGVIAFKTQPKAQQAAEKFHGKAQSFGEVFGK
jgi:copper chaperone NosL